MKQRYLYSIIFGLPGLIVSVYLSFIPGGAIAGFFWIYVFGDNRWPDWTNWIGWALWLITIITFIFIQFFITLIGYRTGKKRESKNIPTNYLHVTSSIALFIVLTISMIYYQRGYLINAPPSTICSNLCLQKAYTSSYYGPDLLNLNSGTNICKCLDSDAQNLNPIEIEI